MNSKEKIIDVYDGLGMPLNGIRRKAFNELNEMVYTGKINVESVTKCFCNKTDFELLSRYDRYGLPFGTQICRNCGLITQTIRMSEDSLSMFYNEVYWPLNMDTDDSNMHYTVSSSPSKFINFLSDEIDFKNGSIAVGEVGCGNGIRLEYISKKLSTAYDVKLFACDYSDATLNLVSKKGIKTYLGGMDALLQAGPLDVLILSHIFEHLVDLKESLNLIDQLTHNDSIIYVEVPGVVDLSNKAEYMFDYQDYNILAHIHNFSLTTLTNVFSTKGFKLKKGSEYVRSIFKKNVLNSQSVCSDPYTEIMRALQSAQEKNRQLIKKSNNKIYKYTKKLLKALLGRS